jgi:hypothetical protein
MKKVLLIIVLLIAIPSCSNEDDETFIKTTTVAISTDNEIIASTTGKNVQRGSMFAWISEMQIEATHSSGYVSTNDFTLVNNGTAGAGTRFIMDKVEIGNNTFSASSKTNEPERLEATQFPRPNGATSPTNSVIINQFNTLNNRNPYAVYTSTNPVNSTIAEGIAQEINIPMKTENSRIIAVFASDDIKAGNSDNVVTITCYVNGVSFGPTATCNGSMNAAYYWSDRNSIAGKSISFRIANNDKGVLDIYDTNPIVIKASNTLKMLYIIKDKRLIATPM